MANSASTRRRRPQQGITSIAIRGYKSLFERSSVEIKPLTILAGANSSGKSSIMQPLLMLKQTLEATYDPGPLLMHGPNVRFTRADQIFSRLTSKSKSSSFSIFVEIDSARSFELVFSKKSGKGLDIFEAIYRNGSEVVLRQGLTSDEIDALLPEEIDAFKNFILVSERKGEYEWVVERIRCFLSFSLVYIDRLTRTILPFNTTSFPSTGEFSAYIRGIIHVPGLRGNPERTYKTTAIGSNFPGTFEDYVASVINHWQVTKDARLKQLGDALEPVEKLSIAGEAS